MFVRGLGFRRHILECHYEQHENNAIYASAIYNDENGAMNVVMPQEIGVEEPMNGGDENIPSQVNGELLTSKSLG